VLALKRLHPYSPLCNPLFMPLPIAVVLVMSKEFVSAPLPMGELHLLLERRKQGSRTQLLPVFYDISRLKVAEAVVEYEAATCDELKQQWARDLKELSSIHVIPDKPPVPTLHP
jgi:hypothetical protein